MKNLEWNIYTYRHRRAFEYCVKKLVHDPLMCERMLERARYHDMDKMLMYLFFDQETAQRLHVQSMPHHLENSCEKSEEDLLETVIDYECAPYTKPDKPLNAYDFVSRLYDMKLLDAEMKDRLTAVMAELGIDHSASAADDPEGQAYIGAAGEVSEEMILAEILRYVRECPDGIPDRILKAAEEEIYGK